MTEGDRAAPANPTPGSPDTLRASLSDGDDRLLVNHWMRCDRRDGSIEILHAPPQGTHAFREQRR